MYLSVYCNKTEIPYMERCFFKKREKDPHRSKLRIITECYTSSNLKLEKKIRRKLVASEVGDE